MNGLTGIGWNTFDYILQDLQYPGSLSLFKLDSTNEAFVAKVFELKPNVHTTRWKQNRLPHLTD